MNYVIYLLPSCASTERLRSERSNRYKKIFFISLYQIFQEIWKRWLGILYWNVNKLCFSILEDNYHMILQTFDFYIGFIALRLLSIWQINHQNVLLLSSCQQCFKLYTTLFVVFDKKASESYHHFTIFVIISLFRTHFVNGVIRCTLSSQ